MERRKHQWFRLCCAMAFLLVGCTATDTGSASTTTSTLAAGTSSVAGSRATSTTGPTTTTNPPPEMTTYLVWTSGGLTEGLVAGLKDNFEQISLVSGDVAELDVGDGWVVPLDAIGLDVGDHAVFDPEGETTPLRDGTVLLGETSASLRGLTIGDTVPIGGQEFQVVGVVSDQVVGAAEIVFTKTDPAAPVTTERYALVATEMQREDFEALVAAVNDAPVPARILAEGETPYLRHADGVLPQVFIKLALGEFSYAADSGATLEQDREWVSQNIVTADVPILGSLTCHRVLVDMTIGAFNQVIEEGLEDLIDPAGFAGCWNPRFVRTVTGTPSGISRHSWGGALDINAPSNRMGTEGDQDPRLVAIMEAWGFGWGGDWTITDPMHFEYEVWPEG